VVLPSIVYWEGLYGRDGTQQTAVQFFKACALVQPENARNLVEEIANGVLNGIPGLTEEEKHHLSAEVPRYQHEASKVGEVKAPELPGFWQRSRLVHWKILAARMACCPPTTACPERVIGMASALFPPSKHNVLADAMQLTVLARYNAKDHCDKLPKKLPANTKVDAIEKCADALNLNMKVGQPERSRQTAYYGQMCPVRRLSKMAAPRRKDVPEMEGAAQRERQTNDICLPAPRIGQM